VGTYLAPTITITYPPSLRPDGSPQTLTDFVKPFEVQNINEFTLEPVGDSTRVTWTMRGTNLYIMKLMSAFKNMDSVAGKHFERGLENLKAVAEQ